MASDASAASEEQLDTGHACMTWPDYLPGHAMNHLLAYPHHLLDALDDGRNEPARVRSLRALLHMIKARGNPDLLQPSGDGSLGSVLGAVSAQATAQALSSLTTGAPSLLRMRLVAPTTELLEAECADMLDEEARRTRCVAVKDEDSVCFFDMPSEMCAPPQIVVDFDKSLFANSRYATLTFLRVGDNGVDMRCVGATGKRLVRRVRDIDHHLLGRLYAREAVDSEACLMLPKAAGDLPASLAGQVANFWQEHMRCHVIPAVLAPEGVSRPLSIQTVTARCEGQQKVATVRALIHPTSTSCMCRLHKLLPVEKRPQHVGERFVSSKAELVLSMCGQKLEFSDMTGQQPGRCPIHRENTPHVPQLPHVCCGSTSASLSCVHRTAAPSSTRKSGLWHRNMHMDKATLLHARILIAGCIRCSTKAEPLIGAKNVPKLKEMCERVHEQIAVKLQECDEMRAQQDYEDTVSRSEMLQNDGAAVDLLRAGGVYSCHNEANEFILAHQRDGRHTPLKGPLAGIAATHGHLFPARSYSGKRKR